MKVGGKQIEYANLTRFQRDFKKALFWAAVILSVYHMLINTFRYVVPDHKLLEIYDRWFGLLLMSSVIVYLLLVRFIPSAWNGVRNLTGSVRGFEYYFLFFLALWYAFSCFMRQRYFAVPAFRDNDWWLYITWLTSFLYFPMAGLAGSVRAKKLIDPMLKIVLIPHIIFFAWVIWQYFHMNYVTFPSGTVLEMTNDNGMGVGENRNITGVCSLTLLYLCIYMVVTQRSFRKVPYCFGIVVYFTTMVLSNCRTAWYASLIMFILLAFLLPWKGLEKRGRLLRGGVGLICIAGCLLAVHWLRREVFQLLDLALHSAEEGTISAQFGVGGYYLSQLSQKPGSVAGRRMAELASATNYARTYESGLSGRLPIYKASFAIMFDRKYNFLFGVTPAYLGRSIIHVCGVDKIYDHAHNFFLQMGVSYGVPVMLASVVFVALLVIKSFRVMFCRGTEFPSAWMVPVYVITQLAVEMPETWITSSSAIICPVFYLFAGWVVAMDRELREKEKQGFPDSGTTQVNVAEAG